MTRSELGGLALNFEGKFIGWLHSTAGGLWNTYIRQPGQDGLKLGTFGLIEGANAIIKAHKARAGGS